MFKLRAKLSALMLLMLALVVSFNTVVAQDTVEIKILYWNWGPDAVATQDQIATGFEAMNPNIDVNPIGVEGTNWGTYLDGVATLIAGGESPDLVLVASEGVRLLVDNFELALPLDEFIAADQEEIQPILDDIAQPMLDALKFDGQQYMLPQQWNNMVIYLNTARLEEAGLEMPDENWTRDEFLEYAQALTVDEDGDGTPERYGYAWDNSSPFISSLPWIFANGSDILSDDYCAPTMTDPGVQEALQFMYDLIYVHKVAPAPISGGDIYNLFQNGDVGMFGAGRWALTALLPSGFEDFNIQYFPGNPDRQTIFGIGTYALLNTTQHPDEAWELYKYLLSDEVQQGLLGAADAPASNIPARRSVAAGIAEFPPANSGIFYASLDGEASLSGDAARMVTAPPRYSEMENIFLRYTGLIFADEMSVADATAAAQTELESVVACE